MNLMVNVRHNDSMKSDSFESSMRGSDVGKQYPPKHTTLNQYPNKVVALLNCPWRFRRSLGRYVVQFHNPEDEFDCDRQGLSAMPETCRSVGPLRCSWGTHSAVVVFNLFPMQTATTRRLRFEACEAALGSRLFLAVFERLEAVGGSFLSNCFEEISAGHSSLFSSHGLGLEWQDS